MARLIPEDPETEHANIALVMRLVWDFVKTFFTVFGIVAFLVSWCRL